MTNILTGKPQLSRFVNRRLILERIRRDGVISRAELAKQTAIRPPTVSAVVKDLIDEGLIEEVGPGETSGGRAPRMIALSLNRPQALGFEMSETQILAGLCDLSGKLCAKTQVSYSPLPPDAAIEQLYEIGSDLLGSEGLTWQKLQGVGVAVPGHLNAAEGHVRWSHPFQWRDVPLKQLCEEHWDVTTDVVNDSLAGGMAVHRFEVAEPVENLVFLYLRFRDASHGVVGLGTGIIINGEPYHGEYGAAGEITTPVAHPLNHLKTESMTDPEAFVRAIQSGDADAEKAFRCFVKELSNLVVHIVNLLEPGALTIGSDFPVLHEQLLGELQTLLDRQSLPYEAGKTSLMTSTLGEYGVTRGAIVPTLQRVFRLPQWS